MIGRIDDNPLGGMTVCHVAQFRDHEAVAYLKVINREVGNLETDTMDTGHCSIFEFDDGKATLAMQALELDDLTLLCSTLFEIRIKLQPIVI